MKDSSLRMSCFIPLVVFFCLTFDGCCRALPPQPERPQNIQGWKDFADDTGMRFRGVLLLKKGESSDNGKIGVKVTDIAEAEPCGDVAIEYRRRARIQFFNPVSGKLLCEDEYSDMGNGSIACGESLGVNALGVRAINTAEGWVLFDLRY